MSLISRQFDPAKIRMAACRSGFSLLEILVVLAVFVIITALAVPMLQRSYSGQQLRSGADTVRAKFQQARVNAIETGDVYGFFYAPGTNKYFVAPIVLGFKSLVEGGGLPVDENELEHEIIFTTGETIQDSRSQAEMQNASVNFADMRPVLFYPDGTSQDATVILQNQTGLAIQVNLRGLTGNATSTRLLSIEEVVQ